MPLKVSHTSKHRLSNLKVLHAIQQRTRKLLTASCFILFSSDNHLVVSYSGGDPGVCSQNTGLGSRVKFHLYCAKTIGKPQFSKKYVTIFRLTCTYRYVVINVICKICTFRTDTDDVCLFEFSWNTKIACRNLS